MKPRLSQIGSSSPYVEALGWIASIAFVIDLALFFAAFFLMGITPKVIFSTLVSGQESFLRSGVLTPTENRESDAPVLATCFSYEMGIDRTKVVCGEVAHRHHLSTIVPSGPNNGRNGQSSD